MAKAKTKVNAKAKSKAKGRKVANRAPTLPSGYKVIGRAPKWDMEKYPVISGVRGPTTSFDFPQPLKRGQKKPDIRTVRYCVVEDSEIGPVNVAESGMLKDFFDQTEEGDDVRIEYLGEGEAKRGQNPPKLFSCGVRE